METKDVSDAHHPDWKPDREPPGWIMRWRAALTLRRYNRAERRYVQLDWKMTFLEAQRMALLRTWAARIDETQDVDSSRFTRELLRIDRCVHALTAPWQDAHRDLTAAHAAALRVLRKIGMPTVE